MFMLGPPLANIGESKMLKSVAGTPVPFNPLRIPSLPIHSRRVGLRTIPSIGGKVWCKVPIVVRQDAVSNASHMVTIDGVNYNNGDTAVLGLGDHTLTWTSGNGGTFYGWSVSGDISVADANAETTTLTVSCGGTLTLDLTAACWFDKGEDCDLWTLDAELSCIMDTGIYQQGLGSLKISKGVAAGSNYTYAQRAAAQCASYFGCWIRANLPARTRAWTIQLYKNADSWAEANFSFVSPSVNPRASFCVWIGPGTLQCSSLIDIVSLQWYWLEIYVRAGQTSFYLDGVHKWTLVGSSPYPVATLKVRTYKDFDASDIWLDWARWFASQEYPPTCP